MKKSVNRSLGALVAATMLVAAGCGGGSDENGSSGDEGDSTDQTVVEGDTTSDTAESADTEPAADADFDLAASFVYAYPIGISRLDPHRASISQDGTTLFPAYDRLVHLAPNGDLIPGLAESWEFSEDGLGLTLKIREGVTFHDGAPFDGDAVKTNLDRARSLEGSSVATDLSSIADVTVVDPTTVEITLSEPNVAIIGSFADRAGIQISPQALAEDVNLDEQMVGAGPYKMVSHTPGASTVFERNEDYWDKENMPKVASLEIRVIADQVARLNALRTGQINATQLGQNQVSEVENDSSISVQLNTELQYFYVVQNRARAGQDDLRVRQGLLHALDREAICDALLFGLCELTDQPFPPGYFAYDDSIDDVLYPYDPEKAQALFDEAGMTGMDLTMLIPAGLPTYPEMAEIIQAQWGEFGINVSIEPAEPTQLGELMFAQESADSMLASWGGRPDPAMTFNQRMSGDGFANPGGNTTEKMTDLIEQSISTGDPDARQEALRAGSREVAESVLEMVVLFPQIPYGLGEGVVFEPYLTAKPEFRNVGITS